MDASFPFVARHGRYDIPFGRRKLDYIVRETNPSGRMMWMKNILEIISRSFLPCVENARFVQPVVFVLEKVRYRIHTHTHTHGNALFAFQRY